MKERPILFSAPMVRAILEGTKTQTRRVCKPAEANSLSLVVEVPDPLERGQVYNGSHFGDEEGSVQFACPYGGIGDRLWVRETWQHANYPLGPYQDGCPVYYRADYLDDPEGPDGELSAEGIYRTWRPSIHMPRSACRIVLEVTGVRIEKLHDITEAAAEAEGTAPAWLDADDNDTVHFSAAPSYRQGFARLWREINRAGAWGTNPWVWVVEFKRIEQ